MILSNIYWSINLGTCGISALASNMIWTENNTWINNYIDSVRGIQLLIHALTWILGIDE